MNMTWPVLCLIAGLLLLWKCADLLVKGAIGLAKRFGIPPLVIGLTIVAMGTSAPEVAASIAAVFQGPEGGNTALGNVFGSNIANLALVGGIIALIRPLQIKRQTLAREVPVMLGVGLFLWPVLRDATVTSREGLLLLVSFVVLIAWTVYKETRPQRSIQVSTEPGKHEETHSTKTVPMKNHLALIIIGLIGLAGGATLAVDGAVQIGLYLGMSHAVIGVTIIAFGTSLPELVTCVVAAVKGHHDISVGNLVGSNIFNTLLVTGLASTIRPLNIDRRFAGGDDYWAMIITCFAFLFLGLIGRGIIGRKAGFLLLCGYILYIYYTVNLSV
jgi:cation:H+ antiporter